MNRTKTYLGPGLDVERSQLRDFERQGGYIIEPKVDGVWCELTVGNLDRGRPHRLNSRDGDTGPIESANRGDIHLQPIPLPEGSILIGELEASTEWATEQARKRGFRRLHLFDVLRIAPDVTSTGLSFNATEWAKRRGVLNKIVDDLKVWEDESRFVNVTFQEERFEYFYDLWIDEGYEGAVLKPLKSIYATERSDGKTKAWARCKRWVTMDYVLTGIEMTPGGKYQGPQRTGAWGLFKNGKLTRVMKAAPPDPCLLRQENVGKLVVEFKGWAKFKSGALRHAQAVRVRTDKGPRSCTL
jgi:hypothetical protein